MNNLLNIGTFSKICRLTVKALRHYDELELLRPALVDPETGYRYYSVAQASEAERIRLLRGLRLPLDDIRELLRQRDRVAAMTVLLRHRQRLVQEIADHQQALVSLERLINQPEGVMSYQVSLKQLAQQPILSIRTHTPRSQLSAAIGAALGELCGYAAQLGLRGMGPPLTIYHDAEFKDDDMEVEIALQVERRVAGQGRMNGGALPACEVACTLHAGPYDQIGAAYRALAQWAQQQGREFAGPPREVYLTDPAQVPDPADYRTEIAWPVR